MSEEFRIIMDMIASAGEGAMTCFVVYLIAKILMMVICFSGIGLVLTAVIKLIGSMVRAGGERGKILREIRDGLGVGSPGYLTECELMEVSAKIPALLKSCKG